MSNLDEYKDLKKQAVQARRSRESAVYKSSSEFRIEAQMEELERKIWPNNFYQDTRPGPLSRLPSVDL